jgi:hypothetical protein
VLGEAPSAYVAAAIVRLLPCETLWPDDAKVGVTVVEVYVDPFLTPVTATPSTSRSPVDVPVVSVFEPPFGSAQVPVHDAAVVPTLPAPATSTPLIPVYVLMLYERSLALSCVNV